MGGVTSARGLERFKKSVKDGKSGKNKTKGRTFSERIIGKGLRKKEKISPVKPPQRKSEPDDEKETHGQSSERAGREKTTHP